MRTAANFLKFLQSDEIPPADEEQWILWQFEQYILTDKEATLKPAEHRRATRDVRIAKSVKRRAE